MQLANYMKQYEKDLEVDRPLNSEVPGIYILPLEDNLLISITEIPGGFALSCDVAPYPNTTKEEQFVTDALMGNLFAKGTGGAILGLNESQTLLTLQRKVDYDVSYKAFVEIIEDFVNSADFWKEEALSYK